MRSLGRTRIAAIGLGWDGAKTLAKDVFTFDTLYFEQERASALHEAVKSISNLGVVGAESALSR